MTKQAKTGSEFVNTIAAKDARIAELEKKISDQAMDFLIADRQTMEREEAFRSALQSARQALLSVNGGTCTDFPAWSHGRLVVPRSHTWTIDFTAVIKAIRQALRDE